MGFAFLKSFSQCFGKYVAFPVDDSFRVYGAYPIKFQPTPKIYQAVNRMLWQARLR